MDNFREKFIADYIKTIENKFIHLTEKERNNFLQFKNQKKLSPHNYNKLRELAERFKVKY